MVRPAVGNVIIHRIIVNYSVIEQPETRQHLKPISVAIPRKVFIIMSRVINDDYSERLLAYITDYVRRVGVPPTVDMMIENVEGKTSKSTVFARLQKMVDANLLTQKNVKGYYYPTSIDIKEVSVPIFLLEEACRKLLDSPDNAELVFRLSKYL